MYSFTVLAQWSSKFQLQRQTAPIVSYENNEAQIMMKDKNWNPKLCGVHKC